LRKSDLLSQRFIKCGAAYFYNLNKLGKLPLVTIYNTIPEWLLGMAKDRKQDE